MMKLVIAAFAGAMFAFGLVFSGMTDPKKVQAFLDFGGMFAGRWDPSLAFVMGGALLVTLPGFAWLRIRSSAADTSDATAQNMTAAESINSTLLLGSATFGIGWGISGYCPGPAISTGLSGGSSIVIFLASMLTAMVMSKLFLRRKP